jgi:hypothetical protein
MSYIMGPYQSTGRAKIYIYNAVDEIVNHSEQCLYYGFHVQT